MSKRTPMEAVLARIEGYRDEAIVLQTEMCSRPALGPESGGDGELDKARWLQGYMEKNR